METLISSLVALVLAPIVTEVAKRQSWPNNLTRAVCIGFGCLLAIGAWALQGASPETLQATIIMGLSAGTMATSGVALWKETRKPEGQ